MAINWETYRSTYIKPIAGYVTRLLAPQKREYYHET